MQSEDKFSNTLITNTKKYTSPYLKSHKEDLINWRIWSDKTISLGEKLNRPIYISSGFLSCHWCKKMQIENYKDKEIAEILNTKFLPIIVDKEVQPDIDYFLIQCFNSMGLHLGWPMNVFCFENFKPFYGINYESKRDFKNLLKQILKAISINRTPLHDSSINFGNYIKNSNLVKLNDKKYQFNNKINHEIYDKIIKSLDFKNGGLIDEAKFPKWNLILYLDTLKNYYKNLNKKRSLKISKVLELTLKNIINKGLYDHIYGGFFRYTVDNKWQIPHFEKMLNDNAYAIYTISSLSKYIDFIDPKQIIDDTLYFLKSYLKEGKSYFSSTCATSNSGEGAYYLFSFADIKIIFQKLSGSNFIDFDLSKSNISKKYSYNFIPFFQNDEIKFYLNRIDNTIKINKKGLPNWKHERKKIIDYKNKYSKLEIDKKIITSSNSLLIQALIKAYFNFDDIKYYNYSKEIGEFIIENLFQDNILYRINVDKKKHIEGFIDDYAFTIKAFIMLYNASLKKEWLEIAIKLFKLSIKKFYNKQSHRFYIKEFTKNQKFNFWDLKEIDTPNPNLIMLENMIWMSFFLKNNTYLNNAKKLLTNNFEIICEHPLNYMGWIEKLLFNLDNIIYVYIQGPNAKNWIKKLYFQNLKNIYITGNDKIYNQNINDKNIDYNHTKAIIYKNNKKFTNIDTFKNIESFLNEVI